MKKPACCRYITDLSSFVPSARRRVSTVCRAIPYDSRAIFVEVRRRLSLFPGAWETFTRSTTSQTKSGTGPNNRRTESELFKIMQDCLKKYNA